MIDLRKGFAKDFLFDVRLGRVPGMSVISIKGHDESLTTTKITIHPTGTTKDLDQSTIDATPATVKVASTSASDTSAGTGIRTAILYGLSSAGVRQSETITMNGMTEVTSSLTYSAVTGLKGATWGSNTKNVGTLWVGSGVFTAGVPATKFFAMEAGENKAFSAYYVVPAGYKLLPFHFISSVASTSKTVELYIEYSTNGVNWMTYYIFGDETGAQSPVHIYDGDDLLAGTHVRLSGISDASGTDISVTLDCLLVKV